ncbi:thioredoxin family protein [Desulfobacterium sp. N47]|uniref:Thioredoxin-like fold domain-containing protein n=1 Tax=uncultured Desulfobacterium sp. TaxID=201089 RepID=E1YBS8_9BACT|nr:hypothetical protein N47_G33460 [uncultured Desulfobacterium sp.]
MDIITSRDRQIMLQWAALNTMPALLNIAGGEDLAGEKLSFFCDEFKKLVPQVQIRKVQDEPFRSPAIIIGRHKNIAYQALPQGKELLPFLEALTAAANTTGLSGNGIDPASQIELPAELSVFIAQQCPHCPNVVAQLLLLADKNPNLRLTITDGVLFENQARVQDIRSVPTLILDNEIRWTGQININEVIRQCTQRDPSQLCASSLRQIIEGGDAARVAKMMSSNDRIFPAFIDLLVHERWSVRLGAMVTVEYLADESPDLAACLIAILRERFADLDESVQGDMVQVLSQLKNKEVKEFLEKIISGDYAESVREAAAEELGIWPNR